MRILVVGAGAIGGYFGGRLLEAKQDVTFLVRPRRAAALASAGLIIQSRFGNVSIPAPPTVLAEDLHKKFDLILLSCKAYDLEDAMASFAPAVGPETAVLPLLNGMRHLDMLDARLGPGCVLGGQCLISTVLDAEGRILHLNDTHLVSFGERKSAVSGRVETVRQILAKGRFESRMSPAILQEMWEKWVFIATGAGITCLMRVAVGDIVVAGAVDLCIKLHEECSAIAVACGFPPGQSATERSRAMLTKAGSELTSSMLRDVERNGAIESDHVLGDLLRRGEEHGVPCPLLRTAYFHLKAYEARRVREIRASTTSA